GVLKTLSVKRSGRLLKRRLLAGEGPVEPWQQRLDAGGLDRGSAPDAQAGRGVAVVADVEGDALPVERRDEALGEGCLSLGIEGGHVRIGDGQTHGRVGARRRVDGEVAEPRGALDEA